LQVPDPDLVKQIQGGDRSAFDELVRRYANPLFGLAYSLLGSAADAEDVVQETFLAALRKIASFEGRSTIGTWLRSIVVLQSSKLRQARKRRSAVSLQEHSGSAPPSTVGTPAGVDRRVDVMAMLDTLSHDHREIVVLRELQQLSYEEISEILGVPLGTVESRLYRARQELRQRFSGYAP
jgi:RNA polymerase sigma-70 factor (ECF subfamily)